MGLMILGFIVAVIVYINSEGIDYFTDVLWCAFIGIVVAIVCGLVSLVLTAVIVPANEYHIEQVRETPIIALRDNQGVVGNRYVFSGRVESELYYYYATEESRGITVRKVKASESYIRYDNDNPRIIKFESTNFEHWYTWLYGINLRTRGYNIIYAPEGTVDLVYEIDLE